MTRAAPFVTCVLAALLLGGCGGIYTQIQRLDDGSYLLVRNKASFFGSRATLFRCVPAGSTPDLHCVELESPK
jgi:hypothetical protein